MSLAYLNAGATDLAAANWSDATGFTTNAQLAIDSGSQAIVTNVDQSGVASGIEYLDVYPAFTGTIGTAAAPLIVDADQATDPHVLYAASAGAMFLASDGITKLQKTGGSTLTLTTGTFPLIEHQQGQMTVEAAVVVTAAYLMGGVSEIKDNATAITTLDITGGTHTIYRGAATVILSNCTVYVDTGSDSFGSTSLTIGPGTTLYWVSGNLPIVTWRGGKILNQLRNPATFGGTSSIIYAPAAVGYQGQSNGPTATWSTPTTVRGRFNTQNLTAPGEFI